MRFSNIYSILSEAKIDDKLASSKLSDETKNAIRKLNNTLDNKVKFVDWIIKNAHASPEFDSELVTTFANKPDGYVDIIAQELNWFDKNTSRSDVYKKDIMQYSPGDLANMYQALHNVPSKTHQKQIERKDVDKVYEDDTFLVVSPKTYEASKLYGKGTKWCISSEKTNKHWKDLTGNQGIKFYFIINKKNNAKFAVGVDLAGHKTGVWNDEDLNIIERDKPDEDDSLDTPLGRLLRRNDLFKPYSTPPIDYVMHMFGLTDDSYYEVREDGRIDIRNLNLSIGISDKYHSTLIKDGRLQFKFGRIAGNFYIDSTKLTSLEGCPEEVGGEFKLFECPNLTSLAGAPKIVKNFYISSECGLKTMSGLVLEKVERFECLHNPINSLTGVKFPEEVSEWFVLVGTQLTSLVGVPKKKIGQEFVCAQGRLTSLEGAPESVGGDFNCSENNLSSLKGAPKFVGGDFNCRKNVVSFTIEDVRAVCEVKGNIEV